MAELAAAALSLSYAWAAAAFFAVCAMPLSHTGVVVGDYVIGACVSTFLFALAAGYSLAGLPQAFGVPPDFASCVGWATGAASAGAVMWLIGGNHEETRTRGNA